ncbi:hypothetical protein [Mucilaginibacter lappiensis]|uniref:hypothetical protein n=1 Tax=Mucilaginibacter lappiensis TaxID=354630 RepID=UPI003D25DC73
MAVADCKDVYEFAYKYRKSERFTGRGIEYEFAVIRSHLDDLERHGYTSISHHDNITGKMVTYIPQTN